MTLKERKAARLRALAKGQRKMGRVKAARSLNAQASKLLGSGGKKTTRRRATAKKRVRTSSPSARRRTVRRRSAASASSRGTSMLARRRRVRRRAAAPKRRRRAAPAPKRRRRRASTSMVLAAPKRRRRRARRAAAAPRRRRRRASTAMVAAPRRRRRRSSTAMYMDRENHAPRRRRRRARRGNPPTPRAHRRAIRAAARHPSRARGRYRALRATRTVTLRDRKTHRKIIVRQTRVYSNPRTSWGEIAWMGGGLIFGSIVSGMLDRAVATRTPEGGNHALFGKDAANAILTRPDGTRLAAQAALIAGSFLLASRMNAGRAGGFGNLLVGVGFGAIARTGLQVWDYWIAPMLFKVPRGDEMTVANRWYPWEQEWNQVEVEKLNAEAAKPTAPGQQTPLPASFVTNPNPPAAQTSTTSGTPGHRAGQIAGNADRGREKLHGSRSQTVGGCGGDGGCGGGSKTCCASCAQGGPCEGSGGGDTTTRVTDVPVTVPLRAPMLLPAEVLVEADENIERVRTRGTPDNMTRAELGKPAAPAAPPALPAKRTDLAFPAGAFTPVPVVSERPLFS